MAAAESGKATGQRGAVDKSTATVRLPWVRSSDLP